MDERTGQGADREFKAGDGERKKAPETEMTEDRGSERHPIHVLIPDEEVVHIGAHSWMHIAPEGTEGHGWRMKVGEAQEGAEGQVYVMSVQREGGKAGEAQDSRGSFLRSIDPDDTEGERAGNALLYPAGPDDLEAHGFTGGVLKPDTSGSWTLELGDNRE